MRTLIFGKRTAKEILRDPLSLGFGLGFPLVLLLLMSMIQQHIPVPLFVPEKLTPGIAVFGLSFFSLFGGSLVTKDRSSSLIAWLRSSPMTAADFILGYLGPLLPMALVQMIVCYAAALPMGLAWTPRILLAIAVQMPMALFQISLGLLCGCCLQEKQVGGICGALLTNLGAWLSGAWFDVKLIGGVFETVAYALPFVNATDCGRMALSGEMDGFWRCFAVVCAYAVLSLVPAILVARKKLERDA